MAKTLETSGAYKKQPKTALTLGQKPKSTIPSGKKPKKALYSRKNTKNRDFPRKKPQETKETSGAYKKHPKNTPKQV